MAGQAGSRSRPEQAEPTPPRRIPVALAINPEPADTRNPGHKRPEEVAVVAS